MASSGFAWGSMDGMMAADRSGGRAIMVSSYVNIK